MQHSSWAENNMLEVRSLIPHAGPMVLLDRIIHADEKSLSAEVTIRSDNLFYEKEGVGAWVGIEYMAQAIAAYAGYNAKQRGESVKVGFLLGTRRYESHCTYFIPQQVLQIYVHHILQTDNGLGSFECAIRDGDTQLASATLTVFQPDNLNHFLQGKTHE